LKEGIDLEKRRKQLLEIVLGIIVVVVAIVMIFIYSEKNKPKDKNKEAIINVVEHLFTGPDIEMVQLFQEFNQALEEMVSKKPVNTMFSPDDSLYNNIDEKLIKMYAPYMTEEYYNGAFARDYWSYYFVYSTTEEYEIKVDAIDITQSDKEPMNYTFTIYLNYGPKDGDKKDITIEGSAQFASEEGKMTYLQIFNDKALNFELRSINEPKKDF